MTITIYLLAATCILSFLCFRNEEMQDRFIFNPFIIREQKQWYRFISSGFIHADWMHLLVNMFVLYMLGSTISKIVLSEKSGSVTMPVAALPDGVYYYTLMNDGKQLVSKRLMISHK